MPCAAPSSRLALAVLASILIAGAGEAGAQMTIGVHPRMPLPEHIPRPITINIAFTLIDFARINDREESFDLQGYLVASWVDPALALKPGESKGERRFQTDALWTPNLEFVNAALGRTNARLVVEIKIARKSTIYIWRILLPLTLLVTTSLVVYRFDPGNLQPLISTTVAILLNVILFNFSIDFALPKVSYLTFVDTYAVTCFFFMLSNMFMVTAIHTLFLLRGAEAARSLQSRALRFMPPTLALVLLAESIFFLS